MDWPAIGFSFWRGQLDWPRCPPALCQIKTREQVYYEFRAVVQVVNWEFDEGIAGRWFFGS
jgi:hypothetical protein